MEVRYILSLLTVLFFFILFFKNNCTRKTYILFVLYFLPFIDLTVTSESLGSFTAFDLISFTSFFFLIRDFKFNSGRFIIYLLLFIALFVILFIGTLQSEFILNSFFNDLKFIFIFIYARLLIVEYYDNPSILASVIKGLKFACIVSIVFLAIQTIIGFKFTFYPYLNQNILDSSILRYPSYFQDPQMYSQFLAMCSFLFLIKVDGTSLRNQYINYTFFILIIFSIFLSGGRSGFLGLCIGMSIIFMTGKNSFRFFAIICCVIGYLGILYFPEHFSIFNRNEGYNDAYQVRHQIWKEAYEIFIKNPLLGIGNGNYGKYVEIHSLGGYYVIDNEIVYYGTESGYLKVLVETGILGFIVSFAFILFPLIKAVKSYIQKLSNYNIFYLIGGILSWMTAFSTLYTLSDKRTLVVFTSLICLLILSSNRIQEVNEQ